MKFLNKNIRPEDFDEYYRRVGNLYDERAEQILSLCPTEVKNVLDLGGGTGNISSKLKSKIVVVDWSSEAEKLKQPNVEYHKDDILDFLAQCNEKFDLVILADVIEEMMAEQTVLLIDGLKRVVGKWLVISTPTHENYLNLSTHQVIYSKEELLEMLDVWKIDKQIYYSDRLMARFIWK